MAVFAAESNGFNLANLNFHTVYGQPHTMATLPGTSQTIDFPAIPLGATPITIPSLTLSFASALRVTAGALTLGVAGDGLTADSQGALTGGTLSLVAQVTSGNLDFLAAGLHLAGTAFNAAAQTTSTADDIALFNSLFTGNDLITLSPLADTFDAGAGNDLIFDMGGNDNILGGAGNDLIYAAKGNDKVNSGTGNDLVAGGAGADRIAAGLGNDVIWAGIGNDTASGGDGQDVFLFKAGDGVDHISGFVSADDQILFMGPVSGLANLHMVQVGADLQVTFSDVTVILDNTLRSAVTLTDFAIGGNAALQAAGHAFFDGWTYV